MAIFQRCESYNKEFGNIGRVGNYVKKKQLEGRKII
jgi:hypothetical protein